jgi:hypothetical protein
MVLNWNSDWNSSLNSDWNFIQFFAKITFRIYLKWKWMAKNWASFNSTRQVKIIHRNSSKISIKKKKRWLRLVWFFKIYPP